MNRNLQRVIDPTTNQAFEGRYASRRDVALAAIAAGVAAANLALWWNWDFERFAFSGLAWLCVGSLVAGRRHELRLERTVAGSIVGGAFVLLGLLPVLFAQSDVWLRLAPIFSGIGLALLAAGFGGLGQFAKELVVLAVLGVPALLASLATWAVGFNVAAITAPFAAMILRMCGFQATFHGVEVALPERTVRIVEGCSGLTTMLYLLGISVFCLAMFPPNDRRWNAAAPVLAIAVGFIVNGFRVAVLTVLAAHQRIDAYHYWHTEGGSKFIVAIAVLIFGIFYCSLRPRALRDCRSRDPVIAGSARTH